LVPEKRRDAKQEPRDCADIKESGETSTGVYTVHIDGKPKQVRCDMTTDGGGWLVR